MKLIAHDEKLRTLKLKIESEDDLWILNSVLKEGDLVYARTSRELKTRSGSKRKGMVLGVKVEWWEYQPFTTRLRVHGIIISGPKELDLEGQRHTLGIDIGSTITIFREDGWSENDFKRIIDACNRVSIPVLIITLDDEEYCIGIIKGYGIQVISEEYLRLPGKLDAEARAKAMENALNKILNQIIGLISRLKINIIIVAGPGFIKEYLYDMLKKDSRLSNIKLFMENTSWGGVKGIREVIKRGALIEALKAHDIVVEEKLLDEFMYYLSKDSRYVAYGLENVENAIKARAVKKLMIISDLVRHPNEELRKKIEELLKMAEKQKAEIKIFSSIYDTKIRLKNLGGIAAILRYPLELKMNKQ